MTRALGGPRGAALPPLALLAAMLAVGLVSVAAHGSSTPPASPHRAQHLEMSRVMPLGAGPPEPSARLVFEASTGASAADTKQAGEEDYDEFTLPTTAAATTPASDAASSIKTTVLKVVMLILLAAKVNTLLFAAWWIIRRIIQSCRPASTPAPSK